MPPAVTLGMGCRKNKEAAIIQKEAENCLRESDIYRQAVRNLASISIKKDEPGLNALAEEWKLPFVTYTEEELKECRRRIYSICFCKDHHRCGECL